MRRTKLVALTASGVMALTVAACSSGAPGGDNTSGDNGGNDAAKKANRVIAQKGMDPTAKGPAPAVKGAKKGGTITIQDASAPPTMDPAGMYYTDSDGLANTLLYRTLTQYKVVNGKPVLVPDLATDLGKESADGLTWTFKVKKGIKYSDGSPVKLQDYVYGFLRSFDTKGVAANGTRYQTQYLVDGDTYKGPYKQPNAKFKGLTTKGDDTLVFHLKKRMASWNFYANFPLFTPVPKAKDKKNDYQLHPVTTGPYKVDSYTKGKKLNLSRNTYWDPKTDPVRHNYADKFVVNFNVTALTSQQQILNNSGPGATSVDINALDSSLAPQVQGAKKNQFVAGPGSCVMYDEIDTRKVPLDVRKAYAVAYPYDQIRKAAGLSSVNFEPATTYAAPSLQGFKSYPPVNGAKGEGSGDPAKAKAMLKKAHKLGFEVKYYYRNDTPQRVASNNAKVAGLKAAGFKVKAISVSGEEYTTKIADSKADVNFGQGTPGWCYDWPTGDSVYPVMFDGSGIADGLSVGQFKNADVNKQIDKILQMPAKEAAPKWAALDKELMTKYLPALPDYYPLNTYTFGNKVHNVISNPSSGMPQLSAMYVS